MAGAQVSGADAVGRGYFLAVRSWACQTVAGYQLACHADVRWPTADAHASCLALGGDRETAAPLAMWRRASPGLDNDTQRGPCGGGCCCGGSHQQGPAAGHSNCTCTVVALVVPTLMVLVTSSVLPPSRNTYASSNLPAFRWQRVQQRSLYRHHASLWSGQRGGPWLKLPCNAMMMTMRMGAASMGRPGLGPQHLACGPAPAGAVLVARPGSSASQGQGVPRSGLQAGWFALSVPRQQRPQVESQGAATALVLEGEDPPDQGSASAAATCKGC
ncbi:hypothetical protein HaLaN_27586 [Haematococcus lacustris]|uniref:Uncharacterized protein n=1 Tax=Haematococcus lacustris TaxID=44745 RepID=A0A6A0A8W7_HAELA|nr:hypothetical protein HaLaN_27586 [Haematococcus lacustris]